MPAYTIDTELKAVADSLIQKYHPFLTSLKITYMFRNEALVTNGKTVAGAAIRVDDRNWAIHKTDFIIEIAKDVWVQASDVFKNAIMDHELSHVGIRMDENQTMVTDPASGRVKSFIRPHDIEEFEGVLSRHGAYHKDLRAFLDAHAEHKLRKAAKEAVAV